MSRAPSPRELEVLLFLVTRGEGDRPVTAADRTRWAARVPGVRVGRRCACGGCPSVDLEDADGPVPPGDDRVVLSVNHSRALVLLFVDDDRLSYLELAPLDDAPVRAFPPVEELDA